MIACWNKMYIQCFGEERKKKKPVTTGLTTHTFPNRLKKQTYHKNLFGATLQYRLSTMMIFRHLSACILVGTNLAIANAFESSVFVDEEGKKLEVLEEELNGVGTTPGMAAGDFSSLMTILTSIAPHSNRHRHLMHPSIHHHQENIFGPNDESINIIIQGAIDTDPTNNPVFVDEEGKMLEAPLFLEEELKNGIDFDPTRHCLDWSSEIAQLILWWCNGGKKSDVDLYV